MDYKTIFQKVSETLNLPENLVEKTYKNYWKWVKYCLEDVNLKDGISEEDFNKHVHSINIPSLGKFFTQWNRVNTMYLKYKNNGNKESKADV